MSTTGAINGTSVVVAMEETPGGATFAAIGGQNSHSMTINNAVIDITNKSSASFRELLAGEGTQSLDLSIELTFNSEATFDLLKAAASDKSANVFQIARGGQVIEGPFMIASWAETSPDGDKLTASASLQSQDAWTIV